MTNILNLYIETNLMLSHYFNKYMYMSSVLNITYHHCFLTVPKKSEKFNFSFELTLRKFEGFIFVIARCVPS